jgi:DNA-binding MarR family transcriptional regulator
MHSITFALKQAHLQSVAFGTKVLRDPDGPGHYRQRRTEQIGPMTPARFDLLMAIRMANLKWTERVAARAACQSDVRRLLGRHPSTVSKMVKRLEEIGWLERHPHLRYRREVVLCLTWKGLRAIRSAVSKVYWRRDHLRFFERYFGGWNDGRDPRRAVWEFYRSVCLIAEWFGDRSQLVYTFDHLPVWLLAYSSNRLRWAIRFQAVWRGADGRPRFEQGLLRA